MGEHQGTPSPARRQCLKKTLSFIGEADMPRFAALALANEHGSGIRVEISGAHTAQLAIAATGMQRGQDKIAEIPLRGIDQPGDFIFRKISQAWRIHFAKRLDGPPRDVRRNLSIAEGLI